MPQRGIQGAKGVYGLISKMTAVSEQRDALIAIMLDGAANMPGCLSYIVARDSSDPTTIWITEVWDSQASHEASLSLPPVQQAILRARPLLSTHFGYSIVTEPLGGFGLALKRMSASH